MRAFVLSLILLASVTAFGSDSNFLYHPYAPVEKDVAAALVKAGKENKRVLLVIGGNWCVSCYRFNSFVQRDSSLKAILDHNYVVYHLNYSRENRNLDYLAKLGNPQRFGFPCMVVLDNAGKPLHTQNSGLLQKGNGYDAEKIKAFFMEWSLGND